MEKSIKEKKLQKNLKTMTDVLFVCMIVFIVIMALSFVLTIIHVVGSASAYSCLSAEGKADFLDYYSCRIIDTFTLLAVAVVGFEIFRRFKKENTPFIPYIGKGLRIIAILLFAGIILMTAAHIVSYKITGVMPPNEYNGFLDYGSAIFVSLLIMLSYIFDRGCELQQESDETI